jgi:hypothetical protein
MIAFAERNNAERPDCIHSVYDCIIVAKHFWYRAFVTLGSQGVGK